jgi:hypothetical protein
MTSFLLCSILPRKFVKKKTAVTGKSPRRNYTNYATSTLRAHLFAEVGSSILGGPRMDSKKRRKEKRARAARAQTRFTSDGTLTPGLPEQPPDEDYFLLETSFDTPWELFGWTEGAFVYGTWEVVRQAYARIIRFCEFSGRAAGFNLHQGKAAVATRLAELYKQEVRYQEEKGAVGRN